MTNIPNAVGESLDVKEIERRCNAATPGPWDSPLNDLGMVPSFKQVDFYFDHSFEAYPPLGESGPIFVARSREDAEFLAHAREDVPALLSQLEALTKERDAYKGKLEIYANTENWRDSVDGDLNDRFAYKHGFNHAQSVLDEFKEGK